MPRGQRTPAAITDEQRMAVEKIMSGMPMTHVAKAVGVHRQRLYEWLEFPHVQEYMRAITVDMDQAVVARLMMGMNQAMELGHLATQRLIDTIEKDASFIPDMGEVDKHLRMMADLYRLSTNQATSITEERKEPRDRKALMDQLKDITPKPPTLQAAATREPEENE